MSKFEARQTGTVEIRAPTRFTWPAMFVFSAYGLLLLLPALLSMLIVSTLPFTVWTYIIPVVALAFATVLLPFGFGNGYAGRVARSFKPALPSDQDCFLVQITFWPRLQSGIRSVLEDADDIGWISWGNSMLSFAGDSVNFSIPVEQVRSVRLQNSGFRALFLYSRVCVEIAAQNEVQRFWVAERSSLFLPASRAIARNIYRGLSRIVEGSRTTAPSR